MSRTNLSAVVSRQLPEHIREDFPTFVAFVEAYYEFLQAQGVDYSTLRDIDKTLDAFVGQFKKELAYNLPNIALDERFLLQNVKDQYLAKGSEGSYKLLFRLLFGKEIELSYPGRSMLRASDGRWNQEISVFAKVDFGDPEEIVGKLVDIQTAGRTLRVLVDKKQNLIGEVDKIVLIDPTQQIFEFFLDKRFFGIINPTDKIKYLNEFQATILPSTRQITISQPGKNFRVGQVFELRSGTGTGALMKITAITAGGGIKYAELIKFGIGYTANFAISLLARNTVNSRGTSISSRLTSTQAVDPADPDAFIYTSTFETPSVGFDEQGYINSGDYVTSDFVDGTYAGSLLREFSLNSRNAQIEANEPAVVSVSLGALTRYPGYFETNNGFLDDSIFIQDSRYYQAFSYVLKIDERLESYKSAVKTMVHPAGMALFGEFNVTINHDISLTLESLIKSLGITLTDNVDGETDEVFLSTSKVFSDSINTLTSTITSTQVGKLLETTYDAIDSINSIDVAKLLENSQELADSEVKSVDKALATSYPGMLDDSSFNISKALSNSQNIVEAHALLVDKSLSTNYSGLLSVPSKNIGKNLTSPVSTLDNIVVAFGVNLTTSYTGLLSVPSKNIGKNLTSPVSTSDDINIGFLALRTFSTNYSGLLSVPSKNIGKNLTSPVSTSDDINITLAFGVDLTTSYTGINDSNLNINFNKTLLTSASVIDNSVLTSAKYINTELTSQSEQGYIQLNSYAGQDIFAAEYSVGSRESTFTTP